MEKQLKEVHVTYFFQVKSITEADTGKTLDGVFTDDDAAEKGWMLAISNTPTPVCS